MSTLVDRIHDGYVAGRRVRVLSDRVAELLPAGARVLDVGCGDGRFARLLMDRRPDVTVEGIDVLASTTVVLVNHGGLAPRLR